MAEGICVKCMLIRNIERHHVLPRKWFKRYNVSVITLCSECHREIHELIPCFKRLSKRQYFGIHRQWIQGKNPAVFFKREEEEEYHGLGIA
jgi:hypothetical protein